MTYDPKLTARDSETSSRLPFSLYDEIEQAVWKIYRESSQALTDTPKKEMLMLFWLSRLEIMEELWLARIHPCMPFHNRISDNYDLHTGHNSIQCHVPYLVDNKHLPRSLCDMEKDVQKIYRTLTRRLDRGSSNPLTVRHISSIVTIPSFLCL